MLILMRLPHIVGGGLWVGMAVFSAFWLGPALDEVGPSANGVMPALARRGISTRFPLLGLATIGSGAWLTWRVGGDFSAFMASGAGRLKARGAAGGKPPADSVGTGAARLDRGAGGCRRLPGPVGPGVREPPAALAAGGASFKDVVKVTFYLVGPKASLATLREVRDQYINGAAPPASTLVMVSGLFRPDVMLEVEAMAVVPARTR